MVILSIVILKAKYKLVHFSGIAICLAGMGVLVWADITGSRNQGPKPGIHFCLIIYQVYISNNIIISNK